MRKSEAMALCWSDVALGPGVIEALAVWREIEGNPEGDPFIFRALGDVNVGTFREHFQLAKVDRAQLYERSASRQPIRIHDLRATFVTPRSRGREVRGLVSDRKGHKSSAMVNRYKRAARSVADLGLGELLSLADAAPELKRRREEATAKENGTKSSESKNKPKWRNGRRGGFKIRCPQGRVGSSPTFGTTERSQANRLWRGFTTS